MTGFLNADGSSLIGGLNPSNVGQGLQVDALGNLKVVGFNSLANPTITEDQLRSWIINGQTFTASIGLLSSGAGTNNYPFSIFNPSSAKSVLIYVLRAVTGTGSMTGFMVTTTVDPAYATAATVTNSKGRGLGSAIAATCTFTSTTQTLPSNFAQVEIDTKVINFLTNGAAILLPAGTDNGITIFLQVYTAGLNSLTAQWVEF